MTDCAVTTDARQLPFVRSMDAFDSFHNLLMALAARRFGDGVVARGDLQRVWEASGGETERMPEAVGSLRRVLRDEARRRVTVVADGDRTVARLQPAVEVLLHDVAVGARRRVIRHVGPALGVEKRVAADPDHDAERYADKNSLKSSQVHRSVLD